VGDRFRPGEHAQGDPVAADQPLSAALSEMVTHGSDRLPVVDEAGVAVGAVFLADLVHKPA
jgi:CBS domain-containing protein